MMALRSANRYYTVILFIVPTLYSTMPTAWKGDEVDLFLWTASSAVCRTGGRGGGGRAVIVGSNLLLEETTQGIIHCPTGGL
jgi:hypothetical protein